MSFILIYSIVWVSVATLIVVATAYQSRQRPKDFYSLLVVYLSIMPFILSVWEVL